jgi:hypothetical protein
MVIKMRRERGAPRARHQPRRPRHRLGQRTMDSDESDNLVAGRTRNCRRHPSNAPSAGSCGDGESGKKTTSGAVAFSMLHSHSFYTPWGTRQSRAEVRAAEAASPADPARHKVGSGADRLLHTRLDRDLAGLGRLGHRDRQPQHPIGVVGSDLVGVLPTEHAPRAFRDQQLRPSPASARSARTVSTSSSTLRSSESVVIPGRSSSTTNLSSSR